MEKYILSDTLKRAVEVALHLNKPLLLCGEPGTGKTTLARHLAWEYSKNPPGPFAAFYNKPLEFVTKTTSTATDLFYSYDALKRLRDAYAKENIHTGNYIELKPLGKAIVYKHGSASPGLDSIRTIHDFKEGNKLPETPLSSIVLIDEIDKAPRDFPNDILVEIEKQQFEIKELGARVEAADNNAKILLIMTSNNEKNLPDAFLRRCVFHYIEFPDAALLGQIIKEHFPALQKNGDTEAMGIVNTFIELNKQPFIKKPGTAEFIDWLHILETKNLLHTASQPFTKLPKELAEQMEATWGLLLKNYNDIGMAKEIIKNM
jgi:MoxR-like ATPase